MGDGGHKHDGVSEQQAGCVLATRETVRETAATLTRAPVHDVRLSPCESRAEAHGKEKPCFYLNSRKYHSSSKAKKILPPAGRVGACFLNTRKLFPSGRVSCFADDVFRYRRASSRRRAAAHVGWGEDIRTSPAVELGASPASPSPDEESRNFDGRIEEPLLQALPSAAESHQRPVKK